MRILSLIILVFLINFIFPELYAQETKSITIPSGTLVVVKTVQEYTSETLTAGQEIVCVVALDVTQEEDTVIRAGTPVFCLVQNASESGMVGSGGELMITFQNTNAVDGTTLPLTGNFISKGESSTGEKVAVGVILCPLALLCKGDEASIPAGMQGRGFTIGDKKIKVKTYN